MSNTIRLVIAQVPRDQPTPHVPSCPLRAGSTLMDLAEDVQPLVQLERVVPCRCLPPDPHDGLHGMNRPY